MTLAHETLSPRPGVSIAFRHSPAQDESLNGVIFLGGFRSDMSGTKAAYLEERCRARGQGYTRFDYTGHGLSSGAFRDGTLGGWLRDARDVLDGATRGPQVLVGSSMGGWIALLLALARPERVAALAGIAAAPDFTRDVYDRSLTAEQRGLLEKDGVVYAPNAYGDPYPLTKALFDEAREHLLLHAPIAVSCPVRLIHGRKDADVPWQKSEVLRDRLAARDVKITWVEDGDHRLSRPADLEKIDAAVAELSALKTIAGA